MSLNNNCNLFEDHHSNSDTYSLFSFEKKDEDYTSISSEKNVKNIDLNMTIDNNLESILVPNEKKTNETERA